MGFEHRMDTRVKAGFRFFSWLGPEAAGAPIACEGDNISVGGIAFTCPQILPKDQQLYMEFTLPGEGRQLRLRALVIRSEPKGSEALVRVQFSLMDGDSHLSIRRYVLAVSDPTLAAATGWGKAYFVDQRHYPCEYRELPNALVSQWLERREYLDAKGLIYLKGFQVFLSNWFGTAQPGAFKMLGSRPLREKAWAWLELELPEGDLHVLAQSLWCEVEPGEKAKMGLQITAYHKEEAMRIEKGPLRP
jgi:hypothetical protein